MKSLSRVVWSEGMYLGPHHFQTQSRYFEDSARFAIENSWFEPWGLISCNLDEAAIRNGRVAVLSAQGMFEDGLAFEMTTGELAMGKGDPVPEPRDIRDIFPPESESLGIFLAISPRRQGGVNCDLEGRGHDVLGHDVRYRAVPRTVPGVGGSLMLVGQGDQQLVFVQYPGARDQSASVLPVSSQVDDTAFASSAKGTLYVVDNAAGQIIAITGNFQQGQAFGSASGLSTIDLKTGQVTPFGSSVKTPKGLLFVPANGGNDDGQNGHNGQNIDSGRHR